MKYINATKVPAAETVTTQRAAEIADALDDIRRARLAYGCGYLAKRRVTARCIREAESVGRPTVRVGYCGLQDALSGIAPDYYTAGVYGWNCDVYTIAGLTICTGYRPAAGAGLWASVSLQRLAEAQTPRPVTSCLQPGSSPTAREHERGREHDCISAHLRRRAPRRR